MEAYAAAQKPAGRARDGWPEQNVSDDMYLYS